MSVDQLVAMAVAEKVAASVMADEFERRAPVAFDGIMRREPDLEEDRLPNDG